MRTTGIAYSLLATGKVSSAVAVALSFTRWGKIAPFVFAFAFVSLAVCVATCITHMNRANANGNQHGEV